MRKVFTVPLTLGLLASGIVVYSLWQPSVASAQTSPPPNSPQTEARSQARVELNKGVQAFKSALYPAAVAHFTTAVELDPNFGSMGNPDTRRISTSHVERQNLTIRMAVRRLTRLTNAFSKKWENLWAAYCLHFAWYNFCRVHQTLRVTPAMEANITDHVWELKELLA